MKTQLTKHIAVLTIAISCTAFLLTNSASALFGKKTESSQEQTQADLPIVRDLEIQTYQGMICRAQLLAVSSTEGAEEEPLTCTIETQPKKGTVQIHDMELVYRPNPGASGTDRFTYTATDSQGRTSKPAQITIKIEKTKSGVHYEDTADSESAVAAQHLAEEGIFIGSQIGGRYCFEPERTVSRSEFLAMVLETTGREITDVTMTGFCDDAAIPSWAKAYVSAGTADGVILGNMTESGPVFRGEDAITLNEAATVLNRLLDAGDIELDVWYADRDSVPSWAAQAVGNMESISVLSVGSFGSAAMGEPVTRGDAAQMLSAVKTLLDGSEQDHKSSSFFDWLTT